MAEDEIASAMLPWWAAGGNDDPHAPRKAGAGMAAGILRNSRRSSFLRRWPGERVARDHAPLQEKASGRHDAEVWDFPVNVGRVRLRNPVVAAAGTYGHGLEYRRYGDPSLLGAVVCKSLTVEPREGFPPPRVTVLTRPGSMLNAVGVANPGVERWAEENLPRLLEAGVAVVASIWGVDAERVVAAAEVLARYPGPMAWEVNLSCPNSEHPGTPVSHDPDRSADVCRAVRRLAPDPVGVWAKLSPDAPDAIAVGLACYEAGADALTLSNTYPARSVDQSSPLAAGRGGMSGSVLRDHVRPLIETFGAEHPDVDLLAAGGVMSSEIALDYLRLGASAVQVGTATLYDPRACHKIAKGLVQRLRRGEL